MTEGEERVQYKNIVAGDPGLVTNTAVATKLGLFTVTGAAIVLACVSCEIGKQVSNYSINYYNGGRYPLPQTLLVSVLRRASNEGSRKFYNQGEGPYYCSHEIGMPALPAQRS